MKIKKAVIPVAGKGTRFLPATKQVPKEMIPILDRPMIHYCVEEAVLSGIEELVFVTSSGKESIENYFDRNLELEAFLESNGKHELLDKIQKIGKMIEIVTVRQKEQLGLGHAVLCAQPVVGNEDFAVILGDDIVVNSQYPVTKQLIDCYNEHAGSVIGVMEVPRDQTYRYGIVKGVNINDKTLRMDAMVEKPRPEQAPTNLATPGRYVLKNEIFSALRRIERGAGGEYQLTDAINLLCLENAVFAHKFEGKRYDTGSLEGYLRATVEFALARPDLAAVMREIIKDNSEK
jgi:UTP--glucose-1-phosphate uridylyltransferase